MPPCRRACPAPEEVDCRAAQFCHAKARRIAEISKADRQGCGNIPAGLGAPASQFGTGRLNAFPRAALKAATRQTNLPANRLAARLGRQGTIEQAGLARPCPASPTRCLGEHACLPTRPCPAAARRRPAGRPPPAMPRHSSLVFGWALAGTRARSSGITTRRCYTTPRNSQI